MKGFTLIEVLVAVFVLATVIVGLTGLGMIVTRTAVESERRNVAQGIANEEMEVARSYSYDQLENLEGKKTVQRNSQNYTVESFVMYVDDSLTTQKQDFKQLTIKVSWPRAKAPVVLASFFVDTDKTSACIPGTITCPPSGGPPADFLMCPVSGKCADAVPPGDGDGGGVRPSPPPGFGSGDGEKQQCKFDHDCPASQHCYKAQCQPDWCRLPVEAPFIDAMCQGEILIEDCTATCPSWRTWGALGRVPTACTDDLYCVVTGFRYERCADDPKICPQKKIRGG